MIGHISGTTFAIRDGFCIVSCGGVGYKIHVQKSTFASLHERGSAALWIHTVVREDALDLYGFTAEKSLHFFQLLLNVSGIGPRSALGILDLAPIETLASAIGSGNAQYLTTVSGIGKKTAEKIILELRDKMDTLASDTHSYDTEALEAMMALGYSAHEAREALRAVPAHITTSNERLREALKTRVLHSPK